MKVLLVLFIGGVIVTFVVLGVAILTWVLATLLPLFGVTQAVNWLHGLALFLLIGFFGSRVRSSK